MAEDKVKHNRLKDGKRQKAKKAHESLDQAITNLMDSPVVVEEMLGWLMENDKKKFFDTVMARMPKVPQIDQDLQKTYISLKSMMEEFPDTEDVISKMHKYRAENEKLKYDNEEKDETIAHLRARMKKLDLKIKELS